ncbi:unnamed protein product, partial [Rotaria magnacalcarata]
MKSEQLDNRLETEASSYLLLSTDDYAKNLSVYKNLCESFGSK